MRKKSETYHLLLLQSLLLLPSLLLHLLNIVLELLLLLNRKSSHLLGYGVCRTQQNNDRSEESAKRSDSEVYHEPKVGERREGNKSSPSE